MHFSAFAIMTDGMNCMFILYEFVFQVACVCRPTGFTIEPFAHEKNLHSLECKVCSTALVNIIRRENRFCIVDDTSFFRRFYEGIFASIYILFVCNGESDGIIGTIVQ